jgi:hypothetical protein
VITSLVQDESSRGSIPHPKKGLHYFLGTKIPVSNEKRFVFLWEEDYNTFNFDQYDPVKSNGVLKREDLDLLERELKKTGYFKIGENAAMNLYICPWIIFLILAVFLFYRYLAIEKTSKDLIITIGGICIGLILAILATIMVKKRQKSRLERREAAFKKVVKSLNRTIF